MNPQEKVDYIFGLYQRHGAAQYYGEEVSQLEHMAQSAMLASDAGYDEEVILAAFFHDIGYLLETESSDTMGGYGRTNHEKEAGRFLREMGFGDRVASLAEQHVNAKRYLIFADTAYYEQLSEASKQTLSYQGGPMTAVEAEAFKADPLFDLYITMRKWDEIAKELDVPLPDMTSWKQMALRVLERNSN